MVVGVPYVCGLDLSLTSSGVAVVHVAPNHPAVTSPCIFDAKVGTVTTKPGDDKSYKAMSERIATIVDRLRPAIERADLVVMEGPSLASVHGQSHTRAWLWGKVYDACVMHESMTGAKTLVVAPAQRMRYATGGSAAKDVVMAAAIKRWPTVDITSNDTADAMVLAAIGCRYLGFPIDAAPKTHWESVMAKLNAVPKPKRRRVVDVELPEETV